jgi:uracil-DNA glycosylase
MEDPAQAQIPEARSIEKLRDLAKGCRACPLWKMGTQTVFGEGPPSARLLLIGEQPGDKEDEIGRPFVGPAGRILNACIDEAGLDREQLYLTNAVKHFKWVPSGARRLHKKPSVREMRACLPWLMSEIQQVEPELILCLGSTAAQSLLGPNFRLTMHRGELQTDRPGPPILATLHPSALLRMRTPEEREEARRGFVADLTAARRFLSDARRKLTSAARRPRP